MGVLSAMPSTPARPEPLTDKPYPCHYTAFYSVSAPMPRAQKKCIQPNYKAEVSIFQQPGSSACLWLYSRSQAPTSHRPGCQHHLQHSTRSAPHSAPAPSQGAHALLPTFLEQLGAVLDALHQAESAGIVVVSRLD